MDARLLLNAVGGRVRIIRRAGLRPVAKAISTLLDSDPLENVESKCSGTELFNTMEWDFLNKALNKHRKRRSGLVDQFGNEL